MKKIIIILSFLLMFFTGACTLTKPQKTLDKIEVTTEIFDKEYNIGEELDLSGGKLTLYYNDGTTNIIDLTSSMISSFDSSTIGNKEVIVTYIEGAVTKTTTFIVTVEDNLPKEIDYIYVATNPIKVRYIEGEEFDSTGMVVEVCYMDESFHEITNYTLDKSILSLGDRVITITYEGFTTPVYVNVIEKSLVAISVKTNPLKTDYIEGEIFDKTGMVIEAIYNNNTKQIITNYTIDKTVLSTTDTFVTILYEGKTTPVNVVVAARTITDLVVISNPNKTTYNVGDLFDPSGLKIGLQYDNGDIEELSSTVYQIHASDALIDGEESIKVTYGEFATYVEIKVLTSNELFQEAVVETGFAYWYNQNQIQYDQSKGRRQIEIAPEEATEYRNIYLDCSSFVYSTYYHTFNYKLPATNTAGLENYASKNIGVEDDVLYYGKVEDYPTETDKQAILKEIRSSMQPGDLINYRHGATGPSAGHVMLYVGNDTFLHSTGSSYSYTSNPSSSTDKATESEARIGSVQLLDASEVFENKDSRRYLFHKATDDSTWSFALLRPLLNKDLELTESAKARLANKGLNIEKTSNPSHMSTVVEGDTIIYTFNIKNESTKSLRDIEVKDELTSATIYIENSITDNGLVNDNNIEWNIQEIKPGETIKLSYSVKVNNALLGKKIDSSKGTVEGIKTNTLWHVVGGLDSQKMGLLNAAITESIGNSYNDSLTYVKELYANTLDINITEHTTVKNVLSDVINQSTKYSRNDTELSKILVPNMYGGVDFHNVAPELSRIRYVKPDYLQCGDLIALVNTYDQTFDIYLYQNNSTILKVSNGVVVKAYDSVTKVETFLMQLIAYNQYAILRPSLDIDGIKTEEGQAKYTIPQLYDYASTNDIVNTTGVVVGMIQDTNGNQAPSGILIMDEVSHQMIAVHNLNGSFPNFTTTDGITKIAKGDKLNLENIKFKKTSTGYISSGAVSSERRMLEVVDGSTISVVSNNNPVTLTKNITSISSEEEMINKISSVKMFEVIKFEASMENNLYIGQSNATASKANAYLHYKDSAKVLNDSKYSITVGTTTSSTKDRGVCITKYDENISYFEFTNKDEATAKAQTYTTGSIYGVVIHVTSTYCVILVVNETTLS